MTLKADKKKSNEQYADNKPGWKPDRGKKRFLNRVIEEQEAEQEIRKFGEQLELFPELNDNHPKGPDR